MKFYMLADDFKYEFSVKISYTVTGICRFSPTNRFSKTMSFDSICIAIQENLTGTIFACKKIDKKRMKQKKAEHTILIEKLVLEKVNR